MIDRLRTLKQRATQARVPCVYVNDNFGRWRSDFSAQVQHCLNDGVRGEALCAALKPTDSDYFVLKPKHSGFYQTCLELLLHHLGAKTLILAGISTENCVTFTANDAFLRGYSLVIAGDACASADLRLHRKALQQMQSLLHAELANSDEIQFARGTRGTSVRLSAGGRR